MAVQKKTVTVAVVADPAHIQAVQELVGSIAAAFRQLGNEVAHLSRQYQRAFDQLDAEESKPATD